MNFICHFAPTKQSIKQFLHEFSYKLPALWEKTIRFVKMLWKNSRYGHLTLISFKVENAVPL